MFNRSIIAGRLVADPVVRYTQTETAVTNFQIDTNGGFIDCVAWGGLAKVCAEYLKKGRLVAVEGRLDIKKIKTPTKKKQAKVEIVIENLQMLDSKFYQAAKKEGQR